MWIFKYMLYILSSIVHTANIEIRECVKWSLKQELKNNGKSLNFWAQKVVMVAHRRWESFSVLDRRSLTCMGGGRLWEVDGYGSLTVVRLISSCLEQTSLPIKDSLYGQRKIKLFHRKNIGYTKVSTCSYRSLLYFNKITSFSKEERNWKKKCMLRLR